MKRLGQNNRSRDYRVKKMGSAFVWLLQHPLGAIYPEVDNNCWISPHCTHLVPFWPPCTHVLGTIFLEIHILLKILIIILPLSLVALKTSFHSTFYNKQAFYSLPYCNEAFSLSVELKAKSLIKSFTLESISVEKVRCVLYGCCLHLWRYCDGGLWHDLLPTSVAWP